jgi:hypothetical protein
MTVKCAVVKIDPASDRLGHVWTARALARTFCASAALVGCDQVSGLLMRRVWPLALMLCADRVPTKTAHSTMQWHEWIVPIAGSTGSALRAVRPPNRHITPIARCDLVQAASAVLRLRARRVVPVRIVRTDSEPNDHLPRADTAAFGVGLRRTRRAAGEPILRRGRDITAGADQPCPSDRVGRGDVNGEAAAEHSEERQRHCPLARRISMAWPFDRPN